jgi:hypothetical protein
LHLWLFFVYFAINKPITIEMKHFVGISLFLLALPMVAAEAPMSYVRVIEFDPLALSYPYLSPLVCNVDLDGTIMDPNRDAVMPIVTPEQVKSIINNSNTNKDAGKRIETEHDWRD